MQLDYNKKQTRENVKKILSEARKIRLIAESQSYVRSPVMSPAPVYKSNVNSETVAKMAIRAAEAEEEFAAINEAIELMDEKNGKILTRKYLAKNELTDTDLYLNLNMSSSSFYRLMDRSLLEFAFCYRGGELVAWI